MSRLISRSADDKEGAPYVNGKNSKQQCGRPRLVKVSEDGKREVLENKRAPAKEHATDTKKPTVHKPRPENLTKAVKDSTTVVLLPPPPKDIKQEPAKAILPSAVVLGGALFFLLLVAILMMRLRRHKTRAVAVAPARIRTWPMAVALVVRRWWHAVSAGVAEAAVVAAKEERARLDDALSRDDLDGAKRAIAKLRGLRDQQGLPRWAREVVGGSLPSEEAEVQELEEHRQSIVDGLDAAVVMAEATQSNMVRSEHEALTRALARAMQMPQRGDRIKDLIERATALKEGYHEREDWDLVEEIRVLTPQPYSRQHAGGSNGQSVKRNLNFAERSNVPRIEAVQGVEQIQENDALNGAVVELQEDAVRPTEAATFEASTACHGQADSNDNSENLQGVETRREDGVREALEEASNTEALVVATSQEVTVAEGSQQEQFSHERVLAGVMQAVYYNTSMASRAGLVQILEARRRERNEAFRQVVDQADREVTNRKAELRSRCTKLSDERAKVETRLAEAAQARRQRDSNFLAYMSLAGLVTFMLGVYLSSSTAHRTLWETIKALPYYRWVYGRCSDISHRPPETFPANVIRPRPLPGVNPHTSSHKLAGAYQWAWRLVGERLVSHVLPDSTWVCYVTSTVGVCMGLLALGLLNHLAGWLGFPYRAHANVLLTVWFFKTQIGELSLHLLRSASMFIIYHGTFMFAWPMVDSGRKYAWRNVLVYIVFPIASQVVALYSAARFVGVDMLYVGRCVYEAAKEVLT